MYEYNATVIRVVDGDTLNLRVDLGFDIEMKMGVRLAGIDAPEMKTPAGKAVRALLDDILLSEPVIIGTIKDRKEKYGRYLAEVWHRGVNINEWLVEQGHAKRYDGGPR